MRTGRPAKLKADTFLTIRIDKETRNALTVLAYGWETSASDAVRRAIREAAKWNPAKT